VGVGEHMTDGYEGAASAAGLVGIGGKLPGGRGEGRGNTNMEHKHRKDQPGGNQSGNVVMP
jgi:hypothetical protein